MTNPTDPNQPTNDIPYSIPVYADGTPKPPVNTPRRKKSLRRFIWPTVAAVAVIGWIATAAAGGTTTTAAAGALPAPTVTVTMHDLAAAPAAPAATAKPTAAPKPAIPTSIGDGTWQVGVDMQAGTYVGTVPSDSDGCYWARAKDGSGSFESILANDNLNPGAHVALSITKSTKYVTLDGCGTLHRR